MSNQTKQQDLLVRYDEDSYLRLKFFGAIYICHLT